MTNRKPDPFYVAVRKREDERKKRFDDALTFAKAEVCTDSGREFIRSCEVQLRRKGSLTDKQVEALYEVDADAGRWRHRRDPGFCPNGLFDRYEDFNDDEFV